MTNIYQPGGCPGIRILGAALGVILNAVPEMCLQEVEAIVPFR